MLGIDVSNHNGVFDWDAAVNAGVQFAYCKASERADYLDPTFERNRTEAAKRGIAVGAYHFASPELGTGAVTEARWFAKCVGAVRENELRPMLDLETGSPNATWAVNFLKETERLLGHRPAWYTYPSFLGAMRARPGMENLRPYWPLWLAEYGPNDGQRHPIESAKDFRVICHQYTSVGQLPGLPLLDLNWCEDRNLLREDGDYLLWRDWDGSDPRPLGIAGTIPQRFRDCSLSDFENVEEAVEAATSPLEAKIAQLQLSLDMANSDLQFATTERNRLFNKIEAAKAALA